MGTMKRVCVALLLVVAAAAEVFAQHGGSASLQNSQCSLEKVKLEVGMPRLEAEAQIASALGRQNQYTLYANNLRGGSVEYSDIACKLRVSFRPGAPAALLRTTEGAVVHRLPIDESVEEFKLELVQSPDPEPTIPTVDTIASCAVEAEPEPLTRGGWQPPRVTCDNVLAFLREAKAVSKDTWFHNYSHVASYDYAGTVMLRTGDRVRWLVRPGGLGRLSFADGRELFLVRCCTK
jgi:hypothetical protein